MCGKIGDGVTSHVCPGSPDEDAAALGGAGTGGVAVGISGRGIGSGLVGCRGGISGVGMGWVMGAGESDARGRFGAGDCVGSAREGSSSGQTDGGLTGTAVWKALILSGSAECSLKGLRSW